jgi:hypothetical protein
MGFCLVGVDPMVKNQAWFNIVFLGYASTYIKTRWITNCVIMFIFLLFIFKHHIKQT